MEFYGWSGLSKFEYMNFNIKGKNGTKPEFGFSLLRGESFLKNIDLLFVTDCECSLYFK